MVVCLLKKVVSYRSGLQPCYLLRKKKQFEWDNEISVQTRQTAAFKKDLDLDQRNLEIMP